MHSETESVNQELQRRKADFTETSAKLDLTQSALKDRQNKLHQVDKKLYSYNQVQDPSTSPFSGGLTGTPTFNHAGLK